VLTDSAGVGIEAEGAPAALDSFGEALRTQAPLAAAVTAVTYTETAVLGEVLFRILPSPAGEPARTLVSPDLAVCADCRREILSETDRRQGYAFTNCTNCGPRYSIIRGVPYDRPLTSMAAFRMCPACQHEYDDPADRRFHAQPNACAACGPSYQLLAEGAAADGNPLEKAREIIAAGGIVAIKGIGGYHLACDARSEEAVVLCRLRLGPELEEFFLARLRGQVAIGNHGKEESGALDLLLQLLVPVVTPPEHIFVDLKVDGDSLIVATFFYRPGELDQHAVEMLVVVVDVAQKNRWLGHR